MANTRSATQGTSPSSKESAPKTDPTKEGAGVKRKAGTTSPDNEPAKKEQKTIPESFKIEDSELPKQETDDPMDETPKSPEDSEKAKSSLDQGPEAAENGSAVVEDHEREQKISSHILEKGILYFFYRGRVGIDEPDSVGDVARSFLVLRPLPLGAKLGDGVPPDMENNRLLALPKKVLPQSHSDRFMIFVEKSKTSIQTIKESFESSDYETKTAGSRHRHSATPVGEGIYALTTTGRETHLAYILTQPSQLGEVQRELGLRERGSFVTSVKNPERGGPANTNLPQSAKYSKEIKDEFRGRAWMPLEPKVLDYDNAQILLIGEGIGELGKAAEGNEKDKKHHHETPLEEMETLEHENELRVAHLKGDDPVFEDLGLNSKEFSELQTTW